MTVEPTELTVDPGGEVTATVTVRNLGTQVEEFRLMTGGPAAPFASISPTTLSIYPDDGQPAVVRFAPARGPQSPAGVAPFEIVARSAIHPDVVDVTRGRLTVTPFQKVDAALQPEISRGSRPARHQVSVTNSGNTPINTQLTFRDQDGELTFEPPSGGAMLRPGTTQDFPVRINGPRRWFGRTERLPFSAVVTPTGPHPPITLNGTRRQTAAFPWWIPTAALAIVAVAIALFAVSPLLGPRIPATDHTFDEAAATEVLTRAGYIPQVLKEQSDTVEAGKWTRTDPKERERWAKGQPVTLYISTGPCQEGPCPVEVPAGIVGATESEARALLQDTKFQVGPSKREPNNGTLVDHVIRSNPPVGTKKPPGSTVTLILSSGPQVSPSSSPVIPSSTTPPPPPPHCKPGYVWREASPADHVCVTSATRAQAQSDNSQAAARRAGSGPYGPNTCVQGYVWREAFDGDFVCVTPDIRTQTREDNRLGPSRVP